MMQLKDLLNYELGSRELIYDERDTILYALAVGADSSQLELVYERDLRALPGYAIVPWDYGRWKPPANWGFMTVNAPYILFKN